MKIVVAGDICLADIRNDTVKLDPRLAELFESADLSIGNLECPLTNCGQAKPYQSVNLRAAPAETFVTDWFDAFSLANNHILDYGQAGVTDTTRFLQGLGKGYFGYGANKRSALKPFIVECQSIQVALFGMTPWYNATRISEGTCPDRSHSLLRAIEECRNRGCFVIVLPHWNYEYADYPSPASAKLARRIVGAGANLVVGAHPHVLQGYETIGESKVFYSLGNFVFASKHFSGPIEEAQRLHETIILECSIDRKTLSYEVVTHCVRTTESEIRLMTGAERDKLLTHIDQLSEAFTSKRELARRFYYCAPMIHRTVSAVLQSMARKQGLWTIVKRLPRIRIQDCLVRLHAMRGTR